MLVREFDFDLPWELIAQAPLPDRAEARLLCLSRATGLMTPSTVSSLPLLLDPGDLLVVNDTRVFPARLLGRRDPSGGAVECLLTDRLGSDPTPTQPGEHSGGSEAAAASAGGRGGAPRLGTRLSAPAEAKTRGAGRSPGAASLRPRRDGAR